MRHRALPGARRRQRGHARISERGRICAGLAGQPYYYGIDQLGSVRRAFASTSNAPAYGYDPYGTPLQASAPLTDFTYAGLFHEAGSGVDLALYRAYDPIAGRWLSRDPLGEERDPAANLYRYASDDPINLFDPSGLLNILLGGGITAAAPTGVEASGGIAVNFGSGKAGIFGAGGVTAGFNVSSTSFSAM